MNLRNKFKKYYLLLIAIAIATFYLSFPSIYSVVTESMMDVPKCDLSEKLQNDKRTGNAGCLIIHNKKILLVKSYHNNYLNIPGGTQKKKETSACTAHRETFEETGVSVKVQDHIMTANNGFHIFSCDAKGEIDLSYSKKYEINQITLLPINDVENYRYPKQLDKIKKYLLSR
jgi:predicted NUDIX family NTP pyrophosphohydrolase